MLDSEPVPVSQTRPFAPFAGEALDVERFPELEIYCASVGTGGAGAGSLSQEPRALFGWGFERNQKEAKGQSPISRNRLWTGIGSQISLISAGVTGQLGRSLPEILKGVSGAAPFWGGNPHLWAISARLTHGSPTDYPFAGSS